MPTTSANQTAL